VETQGYKNLHRVNQSIRELYRAMTPHRIRIYSDNFVLGGSWDDTPGDNFVLVGTDDHRFGANRLAKRIVSHYRLAGTTVSVKFSDNLKPPGNVELSSSNDFTIQIQSQHRYSPTNVAAILAHEVAHIFLHRNGIRFAEEFDSSSTVAKK